jgi:hypothetical protein
MGKNTPSELEMQLRISFDRSNTRQDDKQQYWLVDVLALE